MKNSAFIRMLALSCLVGLSASCTNSEKASSNPPAADKASGSCDSRTPREFKIDGMSCEGCAATITAALQDIPGVESVKVSFDDKKAVVVADESQVTAETVLSAIRKAGYECQAIPPK